MYNVCRINISTCIYIYSYVISFWYSFNKIWLSAMTWLHIDTHSYFGFNFALTSLSVCHRSDYFIDIEAFRSVHTLFLSAKKPQSCIVFRKHLRLFLVKIDSSFLHRRHLHLITCQDGR